MSFQSIARRLLVVMGLFIFAVGMSMTSKAVDLPSKFRWDKVVVDGKVKCFTTPVKFQNETEDQSYSYAPMDCLETLALIKLNKSYEELTDTERARYTFSPETIAAYSSNAKNQPNAYGSEYYNGGITFSYARNVPCITKSLDWMLRYGLNGQRVKHVIAMDGITGDVAGHYVGSWIGTSKWHEWIRKIKENILKHPVLSGYQHFDECLSGKYYYFPVEALSLKDASHYRTAMILGYDDTVPASCFDLHGMRPAVDGAWIAKGSYGTNFGEDGYFYISYCDEKIFLEGDIEHFSEYTYALVPDFENQYGNIYCHRAESPTSMATFTGGDFYNYSYARELSAVEFVAKSDDEICAVGIMGAAFAEKFQVWAFTDCSPDNPASGTCVLSSYGSVLEHPRYGKENITTGYYTFDLPYTFKVKKGQCFSIILDNAAAMCRMSNPNNILGRCFYAYWNINGVTGMDWQDLSHGCFYNEDHKTENNEWFITAYTKNKSDLIELNASDGEEGGIHVTWAPIDNATYKLYRREDGETRFNLITNTVDISYTDKSEEEKGSVKLGKKKYYYYVEAFRNGVKIAESMIDEGSTIEKQTIPDELLTNSPVPEPSDIVFVFTNNVVNIGRTLKRGEVEIVLDIPRVFGDKEKLLECNAVASNAVLRMSVCDVDSKYHYNPEVDRVFIIGADGREIELGELCGVNEGVVERKFNIKTKYLNLKASPQDGAGGRNTIKLKVDVNNGGWVTLVKWMSLEIPAAPPVILSHGINSSGNELGTLRQRIKTETGLPCEAFDYHNHGNNTIYDFSDLATSVDKWKKIWRVDHVNIVAHSMGGLRARGYVENANDVLCVLQIATPNRGSPIADAVIEWKRQVEAYAKSLPGAYSQRYWSLATNAVSRFAHESLNMYLDPWTDPAVECLQKSFMDEYNQNPSHSLNDKVDYGVVAGRVTGSPPVKLRIPLMLGALPNLNRKGWDKWLDWADIDSWLINTMTEYADLDPYVGATVSSNLSQNIDRLYETLRQNSDYVVPVSSAHHIVAPLPNSPLEGDFDEVWHSGLIADGVDRVVECLKSKLLIKKTLETQQGTFNNQKSVVAKTGNAKSMSLHGAGDPEKSLCATKMGGVSNDELQYVDFGIIQGNHAMVNLMIESSAGVLANAVRLVSPRGSVYTDCAKDVLMTNGIDNVLIMLANPEKGTWRLAFTPQFPGDEDVGFWMMTAYEVADGVDFVARLENDSVKVGESFVMSIEPKVDGADVEGSVKIVATAADGTSMTYDAIKDSSGVFTSEIPARITGLYSFVVQLEATTPTPFSRSVVLSGIAHSSGGRLSSASSTSAIDLQANGLYDNLTVDVNVDVATAGAYRVFATLSDFNGHEVTKAWTSNIACTVGVNSFPVAFGGSYIFKHGECSGYVVSSVKLIEVGENYEAVVDERENLFTTTDYNFRQFEHDLIEVGASGSESAVDLDGDGVYDRLDVAFPLRIDDLISGAYSWSASLEDDIGDQLETALGEVTLEAYAGDVAIQMAFDGTGIRENMATNGSFHVANVVVWGNGRTFRLRGQLTTKSYELSQWGAVQKKYTLTFDANGGNVDKSTMKVGDGIAIGALPKPVRSGFAFSGWYTSATGGTKITSASIVTNDLTCYAHWAKITVEKGVLVSVDLNGETEIELPAEVTSIGEFAFDENADLTRITIPGTVTDVGMGAFSMCHGLESVILCDGVKNICEGAFYLCCRLVTVAIPDSVTSIEHAAFGACSNLTSVTIGRGVTSIGQYAFRECTSLMEVVFKGDAPQCEDDTFRDVNPNCVVKVSRDSSGWGVTIPGMWNGLRIMYDEDSPQTGNEDNSVKFIMPEVAVDENTTAFVRVSGGNADKASSVDVYLTYNTATTVDLDLAKGAVGGVVPKGGLKFPLTLSWAKGEVGEKTVAIPVKADKTVEGEEFFTLQLANAQGVGLGEDCVCTVSIGDANTNVTLQDGIMNPNIKVTTKGDGLWFVGTGSPEGEGTLSHAESPALAQGKKSTLALGAVKGQGVLHFKVRFTGDPNEATPSSLSVYNGSYSVGTLTHAQVTNVWTGYIITTSGGSLTASQTYSFVFTQGSDPDVHAEISEVYWDYLGNISPSTFYSVLALASNPAGGTASGSGYYTYGQAFKLSAKPYPGWTFDGWYEPVDNDETGERDYFLWSNFATVSYKINRDATVVAFFSKIPYVRGLADPADGGKVTGSGLCDKGKKVTLKATANKNFTFLGWRQGTGNGELGTGDGFVATTASLVIDRSAKPAANSKTSTTITEIDGDVTYYAVFKSDPEIFVTVDATDGTGAEPTGKGAGKYVAGTITGMGKYAPGKTKIALKAASNKGYVFAGWLDANGELLTKYATYTIAAMGESDVEYTAKFATAEEDKDSIALGVNGAALSSAADVSPTSTNIWAGVYLEWPVAASALSATTVKVAGLPSGLKFTDKPVTSKIGTGKTAVTITNVPANTIYGAPTAASKMDKGGNPTPSAVKFTVTTAGKSSQTYQIDTVVDALPTWAQGTFAGGLLDGGQVSLTVSAAGKTSGKALGDGLTYTLAAPYYSAFALDENQMSNFLADVTATWSYKEGTKTIKTNEVVKLVLQDDGIGGYAVAEDWFEAYTVNWKVEPWKTLGKSFDKKTLTYAILADGTFSEDEDVLTSALGADVTARVTLKFAASGAVTIAGEFVTGYDEKKQKYTTVKATGSATLVPVDDERGAVFIYLTPKGLAPHARCVEVPWPEE